ncbi:MAG TPA: polysaccharide pyruvyl transferase family protein, partial [Acidimicrobiales bacterium]
MPPHLSVCLFTADDPNRVARALDVVRGVADEIVVAVDERVDPDRLDPILDVADRVVRAEFGTSVEENLSWLQSLCRGEWLLRLDGDEVVSEALVEVLADRHWTDGLTHAYVPRRWLWGGTDRTLDEAPWWPDPQLRLMRNDPSLVTYGRLVHEIPVIGGWHRFLEAPIYHLDLLEGDTAARAAKAARYERRRPGLRTESGLSQNSGFYTPERIPGERRTIEVPAVDARRLAAIVSTDPGTISERPADPARVRPIIERGSRADRVAPRPRLGEGTVEAFDAPPLRCLAGEPASFTVRATNCGDHTWSPADRPPVRLAGRLTAADGQPWGGELRGDLPGPVRPGETVLGRLIVPFTPTPGRGRLEIGLVREGVAWFDHSVVVDVDVQAPRRVLVSAGVSPFRHLGDDLIVRGIAAAVSEHLPHVECVLVSDDPGQGTARFGLRGAMSATALTHRGAEATPTRARRRIDALRRDAARVVQGLDPLDPAHDPLLRALAGADAFVIAPGGGLTSHHRAAQLWPKVAEAEAAHALGVPVLVEAAMFGPFDGPFDRMLGRRLARLATRITVRDPISRRAVERLAGRRRRPLVVADVATATPAEADHEANQWLADRGLDPAGRYAVVSLRDAIEPAAAIEAAAAAVEVLASAGVGVVFLPHCDGTEPSADDLAMARRLTAAIEAPIVVA